MARQTESRAEELGRARRLGKAARPSREAAQRSLLLAAVTDAASAKGFEACRVEDVLERSGLSRSSFYKHFNDVSECFMAAFELAVDELVATAEGAAGGATRPEGRLETGLAAVLGKLSAEPAAAQLALMEIHTAGAEGRQRFEAARKRFATLLAERGCLPGVTPGMEMERAEQAIGTVTTVLWMEVGGGTENLLRLVPAFVATLISARPPNRSRTSASATRDKHG